MISSQHFQQTTLPDGLRVLSETREAPSVSVGVWIEAGSIYEMESERGAAHFLEHIVFKGTARRSAVRISGEMDSLGGQMNAFTERELVCYHTKVLAEHLPRALELIGDLLTHPRLDEDDVELERGVILEEIKSVEDAPEELVEDLFTETIWRRSRWGRPIAGTEESVSQLKKSDLRRFMQTHYTPPRVLVAAAGAVSHEKLVKLAARLLRDLPRAAASTRAALPPAPRIESRVVQKSRDSEQMHLCCGTRGTSYHDPNRYAAWLLDSILSGGYSSRLFQEIREKRGLCYNIGSMSASYRRAGFWGVSTSFAPEETQRVVKLIGRELRRVKEKGVGKSELKRAQEMMRINALLAEESSSAQMSRIARHELYYGRQKPTEETLREIASVTPAMLQSVARQIFAPDLMNIAAIGPFEKNAPPLKLEV